MNILSLDGISKTLGDAPLFTDVTLGIDEGDKIGFIGNNGSGKSTFLKLLTGEIEPDSGILSRKKQLSISRLEQRPFFTPDMTVQDYFQVEKNWNREKQGEVENFSREDIFRSYCRELGIGDTTVAMKTLSGGMVRKTAIARCLASRADFIALDEPTNHLDIDTIEWMENLLRNAQFGFILVTHDRYFLDSVCTSILEIDRRHIYKYSGNYSAYLERKAERDKALERSERRRNTILRIEMEWLGRGPKARRGKDKGRKARIQDLMDSGIQKDNSIKEFSSTHRRLGKKVLELQGISKNYNGKEVIRPFTYSFRRGERIGIIGPNGSGKTTFLDLVSGRVVPGGGSAVKGDNTVFAYFDQSVSYINGKLTVLEYIREQADRIPVGEEAYLTAEQFLERFLFPRRMFTQTLEKLSGGELRRLHLIRLLASAPNFLLLDEPTNDFDIETISLLEDYLNAFKGCILVVSHDRALLDRITDYLFIFDLNGGIRGFNGNYMDYREMVIQEKDKPSNKAGRNEKRKPARREKKDRLSYAERMEFDGLLSEIADLEDEQKTLEGYFLQAIQDPAGAANNKVRYQEVLTLITDKIARWEELTERDDSDP
ncbi:MAG TPA: ABC-F family ATP-binding cassette domain-containing protein [Spirochaetia bacterium]|nr:ABC-F family ATP-binding cassette domain-containing protein [Spirochaetia bacterium]